MYCNYTDRLGRRCAAEAVWRLQLSSNDPFTLEFSCTVHVDHWKWTLATWVKAIGPLPEEPEGEGAD